MADDTEDPQPRRPRRSIWKRRRWWVLLLLFGILVWFDGPGWRWLVRKAADRYLSRLALHGEIVPEGRLSQGRIGVRRLDFEGDAWVTRIELNGAEFRYALRRLFRGELDAIAARSLHLEVDLAEVRPRDTEEPAGEKEATDPAVALRAIQRRLAPMAIDVRDLSLTIRRGDEPVFELARSNLHHDPGEAGFLLELGPMVFSGTRHVGAQSTRVDWQPDALTLAALDVMPGLSLRDLSAHHPEGAALDFSCGVMVDGTRFDLETNLVRLHLAQADAPLSLARAAALFEIDLPLTATLHSLDLETAGLDGGLATLTGASSLTLGGIESDGLTADRLAIALQVEDSSARVAIEGEALGSPVSLRSDLALLRGDTLRPESATVEYSAARFDRVLAALRDRFAAQDDAAAPPESTLKGAARIAFQEDGSPTSAETEFDVTGSEEIPGLHASAAWSANGNLSAAVRLPGAEAQASFDPALHLYEGTATFDGFAPGSLEPWLKPFGRTLPPDLTASLAWKGSGNLEEGTHRGDLELTAFEWQPRKDESPIQANATVRYEWPRELVLQPLELRQAKQTIEADVRLENQVLALRKLSWTDGDDTLLHGSADIPVGDDPTDWKAILRSERPVSADLESTRLPLSKLHPFLPEATRFPEAGSAQLNLQLSGTPADPVLDARFAADEVGLLSQPELPPIHVDLRAVGRDQTLKLEGSITAPDYPPAVIDAVTLWDPDLWAEDPETLKAAPLDASVTVSQLNVGLFSRFVPKARRLEGEINARLEATGKVGEPRPHATLSLDGGRFEMHDPSIPRIKEGTLKATATPERVELETLTAVVSGGTLEAAGHLTLQDGQPESIDLRLDSTALPVRRDESMIVRASTELGLSGPWQSATLQGTIHVVDSLFYKDIELLPIGVPFNQPSEPTLPTVDPPDVGELTDGIPPPFRDWNLDLQVRTRRPILIRGNLASGEIYLDADIAGTVAQPRPTGGAKLREVTAKLPFSTLEIERGEIKLQPDDPFDPVLDLRGESTVRPYEIKVFVYGPVSDAKVQPTSNPPLPETEIMTLLATGTTTSGFEDPQAATARAIQLLVEELRRGRIRQVRGMRTLLSVLDKVEFQVGEQDPYTSTKYNSATVELDDNWLARAGISDEGNTRATVIYLIRFR